MRDDTISRQAAIDYFVTNVGFHDEDGDAIEDSDELRKIWTEYFDGIPSVDAVPVVRCKDCKHSERWYRDRVRCFLWHKTGTGVFEDGYCNYAERKNNGPMR